MKKAIHLLDTIKHGGAESVAFNYSKVMSNLDISSIMIGKIYSKPYVELVNKYNIDVVEKLTVTLIEESDYIFIHSNKQLINLLRQILLRPNLKKGKKIFYIQHLFYSKNKFRILSKFINYVCTGFIQITPIITDLVSKYIEISNHFIVNFYINKYTGDEYKSIKQSIFEELNINYRQRVIMFSGVFKPGKGIDYFIELAYKFKNCKDYIFLVIGDGPERQIVKDYVEDNLIWIGFQNDVEKYLIGSDIYVFTSKLKEMLPMALVEAINTDKKILAFDTEINNFLLQNKVFSSLEDMKDAIIINDLPSAFNKYNEDYAMKKFREIL